MSAPAPELSRLAPESGPVVAPVRHAPAPAPQPVAAPEVPPDPAPTPEADLEAASGPARGRTGWTPARLPGVKFAAYVVAAFAAWGSFLWWAKLGAATGWGTAPVPIFGGTFDMSWTLAITVDLGIYVAVRAWTTDHSSERTDTWGRAAFIGLLAVSASAQIGGHIIPAGHPAPWLVTVMVAMLPPIVLFLILHLWGLMRTDLEHENLRRKAEADEAARTEAEAERARTEADRRAAERRAARQVTRQAKTPANTPARKAVARSEPVATREGALASVDDLELAGQVRALDSEIGRRAGRALIKDRLGVKGSKQADRVRALADELTG